MDRIYDFADTLTDNPMIVGIVVLVIVVIFSAIEKRRRSSEMKPRSEHDDPLADEEKIDFPTEEQAEAEAAEDNYFPDPPSDLMPIPMNTMEPIF